MTNDDHTNDVNFDENLLLDIRQNNNVEVMRILQGMTNNPYKMVDNSGTSLLHVAADCGNIVMTEFLIIKKCNVDAVDNLGNTPLILALRQGHKDHKNVANLLIEANASVLIVNNEGESPATIAFSSLAFYKQLDILDKKIKKECLYDSLKTAKELMKAHCFLPQAVEFKDTAITKYLLENGQDVNEKDLKEKNTALHEAVRCSDLENIKLLISYGADINAIGWHGNPPLTYAIDSNIVEFLVDHGARLLLDNGKLVNGHLFQKADKDLAEKLITQHHLNLSTKETHNYSLLHYLVQNSNFDPVEILKNNIDDSFDINEQNEVGETYLMYASCSGNYDTVEFLLERGAEIDIVNRENCTTMFHAIYPLYKKTQDYIEARAKIIVLLLQYGAEVQIILNDHYTLLDSAKHWKCFMLVKFVIAHLAIMDFFGYEIKALIRNKINSYAVYKKLFNHCKTVIEKLEQTVIKDQVTLLDFLTVSEKKLISLASDKELVSNVQMVMKDNEHSNLYYYKVLRQRTEKVVKIVNLRENTFEMVSEIEQLQFNDLIINKIVRYVICDDLRTMERRPTFQFMNKK